MLIAIVLAVAAAAATWLGVPWLRHRSDAMPVPAFPESEQKVMAALVARPDRAVYLYELTADHFVDVDLGRQWAALYEAVTAAVGDPRTADGPVADEDLERMAQQARDGADGIRAALTAAGVVEAPDEQWVSDDRDEEVVEAASDVYGAALERETMAGAAPLLRTPDGKSVVRHSRVPAGRRAVFAAAAAAGAAVAVAMASAGGYAGVAWGLAVAAGLALVATSVVVAWVDLDTLFLDRAGWAIGTASAWALTAAVALLDGTGSRLLIGAAAAALVAALFEGLNVIYRLVRGRNGQGGGDTLIVVATVGVPAALLGSWTAAYWSLQASLVTAIVAWLVLVRRSGAGTGTPFAFGPMLALGWVFGVGGWLMFSS